MNTATKTLLAVLAPTCSALAASGAKTEGPGMLTAAFLAFGAVVVLFQVLPAVTMFGSMIIGLFSSAEDTAAVEDSEELGKTA